MTNEIDLNVDVNDDMIIIDDRNDDDDDQDDIYEKIRKQVCLCRLIFFNRFIRMFVFYRLVSILVYQIFIMINLCNV